MHIVAGILVLTLFIGSWAIPTPVEDDLSIFFEHADPNARIVGGTQAAAGSHPHMVALSTGLILRYFACGASLITPRSILTAAHCLDSLYSGGSLSNNLRVRVGSNRWNYDGTTYSIARNITHPNYVRATIKNDIAILVTASQVAQSTLVRVATLNFEFVPGGVESLVAGWGNTRFNGAISQSLRELVVTTIDGQECARLVDEARIELNFPAAPHVDPNLEVCTFHAPDFGTCNGDSGSALLRKDRNQQIGIVSWGFPCARGVPDMFVRISAYQIWLQQNVV